MRKLFSTAAVFLVAISAAGCDGSSTTTYAITGAVSGAATPVTVNLTGASTATTSTGAGGAYSFTGLKNGTYSVTPSAPGYSCSPASATVTVDHKDVSGVNFTATSSTGPYKISGTVSGASSAVTLTLSGSNTATATTGAGGAYSFTGLGDGTYTVTPTTPGYSYSPATAPVMVQSKDVSGVNFTATPASVGNYKISGTVSGAASAVTLTLSGAGTGTTTTGAGGAYSFTGLGNGSYAVTPTATGYTFSPLSATVTVNGADVTGVNFAANAVSLVLVSADIATNTTWTPDQLYRVTKGIRVSATLTIQPGTVVEFAAGASLDVTGKIIADGGSAATPVVFTSSKVPPAGGDWAGITLRANNSIFNQCAVFYAGASDRAALTVYAGMSATVTNCVFAHHLTPTDSIAAAPALDASGAAAGTVITGNRFYDNRVPLAVNATFSIDDSNAFDNSAAMPTAPQPNKYNGIVTNGCAHVKATITWAATKVPFVIGNPVDACSYLVVDNGGHLTIAPTVNVKFFTGGNISVAGTLTAGTSTRFTSVKDDANGGDTNGDGAGSSPAAGDWDRIWLRASGSSFDGVQFLYGGGHDESVLVIAGSYSATVKNSLFSHNRSTKDAIDAAPALDASDASAATVITGNNFFDNMVPLAINTTFSIDDSNSFAGVGQAPNKYQAIIVAGCGHVASAINWSAVKVPLVIGNPIDACNYLVVDNGGHLTIADTTVMKFFNGGSIDVNGILTADAASQIVFTSYRDDAHGGDTNADGAGSAPAGGDWDGLNIRASGSVLGRCLFLYGGGLGNGGSASALYVAGGKSVSVTNSTFAHTTTSNDTLRAPAALDLSDAAAQGTVVTGNRLYDNTSPLAISATLSLDDSNSFDSGVPGQPLPNKYPGIMVQGCGHVSSTTTWLATKLPLVIGNSIDACNYLNVDNGGHLNLGPNVAMKFFLDGSIGVAAGGILSFGSGDYLTSIKDDTLTDTNADGSGTAPTAGDWRGVKYYHSGSSPTCETSCVHYDTAGCTW
jgi:hypothetical protein